MKSTSSRVTRCKRGGCPDPSGCSHRRWWWRNFRVGYGKTHKNFRRIDKGDIPREFKEKALVGLQGLCCVTHPEFIRKNSLLGKKIGLFEVKNQLSSLEVRSKADKSMAEKLYYELMDASQNKGSAIKKREDTHKMAESNKAFAHFRW